MKSLLLQFRTFYKLLAEALCFKIFGGEGFQGLGFGAKWSKGYGVLAKDTHAIGWGHLKGPRTSI